MAKNNYAALSTALLRVVVAFVFLWHGIPKAFNPSMAMEKFVNMGFPAFTGPIVGWVEVIAGAIILLGITGKVASYDMWKWSNYALAIIIIVAILGVQLKAGTVTAGLERDLMLLAGTLLLSQGKPGAYAWQR